MKMLSVVLALALGLMARSSPVSAQVMNASAAVSALKVEQVRVQAPGTAVELGTVSEVDRSTLYVLESEQEWLIDIGTIERLEVRRRSVVKYALIFGAVGGLAGFGASQVRESMSATPFLLGGVGVGAVFGYTQWQWRVT